ncbi:MAG: Gfo/Idh/MocA family oxidoreductase, partial [Rhodothermales bacterium]|nr:Gfo/Idh/MocA family oxidoreductase [Rhodothermales bacterium]
MKTRLAVVGAGYWGKNLLRNFHAIDGVEIAYVSDMDPTVRDRIGQQYPESKVVETTAPIFEDASVDAVVVATETPNHFAVAEQSLLAGKHTFVEKPLAQRSDQADRLAALADREGCKLMTGHLLMYHPAFEHVAQLIKSGTLGDLYYMYSTRVNLGIIRTAENAFESLAPHDLSVALWYMGTDVMGISATGASYLQDGIHDVVFATVTFDSGRIAHLHTSWLDPHKARSITVVGSEKMAVIDDVASTEKVRIYDKGVNIKIGEKRHAEYGQAMNIRSGDIQIPHIQN